MKGRGSLQQQQGRGRGYFGARGGRGPLANNNHQRGECRVVEQPEIIYCVLN